MPTGSILLFPLQLFQNPHSTKDSNVGVGAGGLGLAVGYSLRFGVNRTPGLYWPSCCHPSLETCFSLAAAVGFT